MIHHVFIEHLLCAKSHVDQWRYKVELREFIGRKNTLTWNFKIAIIEILRKYRAYRRRRKHFMKSQGKLAEVGTFA